MADILVIAEHLNGQVAKISKEMLGAGNALKAFKSGALKAVLLSDGDANLTEELLLDGVDEIISINVASPHFDAAVYEEEILALCHELQPAIVLFGHTANGLACAAALAARVGAGFASDIIALAHGETGVIATRSAHAGKVNMDLVFPKKEAVVLTCRGATFPTPEAGGNATITDRAPVSKNRQAEHLEYVDPPAADIDIGKAEIILSVGRGIQNADNIPRFAAIADSLGATLGCSRPFADAGHLPKAHQVGQSGTVAASCKLYIAVGISGAVQHLYGMKHVDTVIAVNNDPAAPIFGYSKFGSTIDALELATALEKQLGLSS
ncbi:MAG: electron transfer flavoprotein subunit alpha/FixB family protein [Pseudooceanicola sp.]